MPQNDRAPTRRRLAGARRFDQLIAFLRDDLDRPIRRIDFEDLTFDYTPDELGIDAGSAAKDLGDQAVAALGGGSAVGRLLRQVRAQLVLGLRIDGQRSSRLD